MSKKYSFSAQKVLDWYRQALSSEQLKLEQIANHVRSLDSALDLLAAQRDRAKTAVHSLRTFQGSDLLELDLYLTATGGEMGRIKGTRAAQFRALEAQRKRVVDRHRQVKLLEKLKEKKRQEWLQAVNLEETAEAADLFHASVVRDRIASERAVLAKGKLQHETA